jgi:hypothetical protein
MDIQYDNIVKIRIKLTPEDLVTLTRAAMSKTINIHNLPQDYKAQDIDVEFIISLEEHLSV